jgi:hypothetical protein
MATIAPADSLAARFERLTQDYPEEIAKAKIGADKMRSDVTRPSQGSAEPALIYRFSK